MGNKAAPTNTSTAKTTLSPEQEQLFSLAMPYAQQYAATPPTTYKGQTIAGFTPEQIQAQEGYVGQVPQIEGLADKSALSQAFMLDTAQLNPESNPYLASSADAITQNIQRNLVEKTLPVLRGTAIENAGMYGGGSTRALNAENRAVGEATTATGKALNDLYFNAYNTGLSNISRAQQLNPQIMAQQLFGPDVLSAVGGQKQQMEQAILGKNANEFYLEKALPYLKASELMSLITGMPAGSTTTTNTGALPQPNPIKGALGGAAAGAAVGSVVPVVGTGIGAVLGALAGAGGAYL